MSRTHRNDRSSLRPVAPRVPRPLSLARRPAQRRRGVLLLVVLSMLVLFVLLTVTYVIVATKERSGAKAMAKFEQAGDPPAQLLDSVFMMVARDTTDIHSPLRSQSLLEHIYGNVSFRGTVATNSAIATGTGGQFYNIVLNPQTLTPTGTVFNPAKNYYKGCVLTMLSGPCAGCSARIVYSDYPDPKNQPTVADLTVMRFHADAGMLDPDPTQNDAFLINGPAYAGMGRGYDPAYTTGQTLPASLAPNGYVYVTDPNDKTKPEKDWEYALLPNPAYFQSTTTAPSPNMPTYTDPAGPGGANVDYTAYDYNNMYLGLVTNDPTNKLPPVLPSFHRSDLYAYWLARMGAGGITAALERKILFRPNHFDHPIFCAATNQAFNAKDMTGVVTGPSQPTVPLDVDNMGSGIPDSIWMDVGLPVMTAKDGRTYKPLIAPLILDLDGRVNLNAHGSYTLVDPNMNYPANGQMSLTAAQAPEMAGMSGGQLSVGEGYGPAEISLLQMFSKLPPAQAVQIVQSLLTGGASYPGRHGYLFSSIASEPLAALKCFEYPPFDDYRLPSNLQPNQVNQYLSGFGTPSDLKGRRMLALDYRGLPLYLTAPYGTYAANDSSAADANSLWQNEVIGSNSAADNPYEFNLFATKPGRTIPATAKLDNPFTVAELERVMRPYDIDNRSLAPRLAALLQPALTPSNPTLPLNLTTESWDVPVPSLAVPRDLRATFLNAKQSRAFQITDLVRARLQGTGVNAANMDGEIAKILPPEMLAGLKMDINRPLSDGRVDNNNSISIGVSGWPYPNPVPLSLTNVDPTTTQDKLLTNSNKLSDWVKVRQLMARQLYALMMLCADQGYVSWIDPKEITPLTPTSKPLTIPQQQELTARRVAQWAINAVSFRDTSSIMIPFEYHWDIYRSTYQGWTATGDLSDVGAPGDTSNGVRVVWSCKPPDLVLTETLAFHDRATADTEFDGNNNTKTTEKDPNKTKDPNFDQVRVPQGSLFIELYCCRNPNNPVAPSDLYTYKNGQWLLEVSKPAPDGNPIWRMVITEATTVADQQYPNAHISQAASANPETFTIQSGATDSVTTPAPLNVNMFDNTKTAKVDRTIWLGQTPPPNPATPGLFYNYAQRQILVPPAHYAVLGPRPTTYVGSLTTPYCVKTKKDSQAITLAPNSVATANTASADPDEKTPTLGVIIAANPPAGWQNAATTAPQGIGLNVSEPLPTDATNYYPEPTVTDPGTGVVDAYGGTPNATNNGLDGDSAKPFLDNPLELGSGDPNAVNRTLQVEKVANTGTYPFYKHVLLQRLANPLVAWNATTNPYITVDWMPIDLTTFSGEQAPGSSDPDDQPRPISFASRQRGYGGARNNLWSPVLAADQLPNDQGGAAAANFQHLLQQTVGYLNQSFGQGFPAAGAPTPAYVGDPQKPFPWITWNARPYASVMELLQVPASSPDRLLWEFNSPDTNPAAQTNPPPNPYDPSAPLTFRAPFPHLLNFLSTVSNSYTPAQAANFYRVLDYLTVPSRFVGTETVLNPKVFAAANPSLAPFLPPFNTVSNYRDPGRININTVTSPDVWNAISNGFFPPDFLQKHLIDSRRGDDVATGSLVTAVTTFPTSFANPFRSAASADLVPIASMVRPPVNTTLLRPDPAGTTFAKSGQVPLFGSTAQNDYNNASRNAYFAYQGLDRISNNITTRSNVFAVWITVGYFEVLPWPQKGINYKTNPATELNADDTAAHADGFQLGAEMGSDTGDIVRHRAFYIFDRSIPVGYERGQNHNVNRAILLRRYIE